METKEPKLTLTAEAPEAVSEKSASVGTGATTILTTGRIGAGSGRAWTAARGAVDLGSLVSCALESATGR